ncbi:MAG: TIGR00180 family glycosyltransferase, partial [Actinobacteria bacterium]|nr:TIGR00180 family glycosyltransferase [Actinomycetota bacterium]
SYNRHDALRRQLLFYADKSIHLIFADGSDEDWGQGISGSIGEMTWEYFRIPGLNSYPTRFGVAVDRVKTEFVFFLDDEECILLTGVEQAIKFLNENRDHSCAGGMVGIAYRVGKRSRLQSKKLAVADWGRFSKNFSLTQDSFSERLLSVINRNRTANIFYQVHRTEIIKKFSSLSIFSSHSEKLFQIFEVLLSCSVISQGKWQMENYPYWFRYGGSISPPVTMPKFIDEDTAKMLADLIIELSEKKFYQVSAGFSQEEFMDELIYVILKRHGEFGKQFKIPGLERSKFSRVSEILLLTFLFQVLIKFKSNIKSYLFAVFPSVFERIYPSDRKRVSSYSKIHASNQPKVIAELATLDKLWSNYPDGLSKTQLKTELASL